MVVLEQALSSFKERNGKTDKSDLKEDCLELVEFECLPTEFKLSGSQGKSWDSYCRSSTNELAFLPGGDGSQYIKARFRLFFLDIFARVMKSLNPRFTLQLQPPIINSEGKLECLPLYMELAASTAWSLSFYCAGMEEIDE